VRYAELRDKGEMPVYHEVLDDIVERDYNDSHRAASPLKRAEDAVLVDYANGLEFSFIYWGEEPITIYAYMEGTGLFCEVYKD